MFPGVTAEAATSKLQKLPAPVVEEAAIIAAARLFQKNAKSEQSRKGVFKNRCSHGQVFVRGLKLWILRPESAKALIRFFPIQL